jgi:hypothetical protein
MSLDAACGFWMTRGRETFGGASERNAWGRRKRVGYLDSC